MTAVLHACLGSTMYHLDLAPQGADRIGLLSKRLYLPSWGACSGVRRPARTRLSGRRLGAVVSVAVVSLKSRPGLRP